MIWRENTYTVYKRDGKYHVCDSSFNHRLSKDEIHMTGLTFAQANNLRHDLAWRELTNQMLNR